LKTNGDCAQISWCPTIDAWAIGSKNVCLVARTAQDVKKHYPDQSRYYLVRKIALWWFRKVRHTTDLGQGRLEALKEELADKTLIGEYIGHNELVNLISYGQETILFNSVVSNKPIKGNAYCLASS